MRLNRPLQRPSIVMEDIHKALVQSLAGHKDALAIHLIPSRLSIDCLLYGQESILSGKCYIVQTRPSHANNSVSIPAYGLGISTLCTEGI